MHETQNIFDDDQFFAEYRKLRAREHNYNRLLEQPAIRQLLPNVTGMTVLDLGCGFGDGCSELIRRGASRVVGMDCSEKMLSVARCENAHRRVEYLRADMNEFDGTGETYDLVFSSLAMHYVEDFQRLLRAINRALVPGGLLVFSQEHPLTTAPLSGPQWINEDDAVRAFYPLTDYLRAGERSTTWLVDGVRKYHRPVSHIVNGLVESGFAIETMLEPLPHPGATKLIPSLALEIHKPCYLMVRTRKCRPAAT